jgi:FMN-dependent NADH-azoreductase
MNVLHICANPKPTEESASKQLATSFFSKLVEINPDIDINNVDLYHEPPPFLDADAIRGAWFPVYIDGYTTTKEEKDALAYADAQAEVFNQADVVVLTLPMWNYSVPAIMKAWLDQILVPNRTFTVTKEDGVKPLHKVRKLVMLVASGGVYKEYDPRDALTSMVENLFGWIGIDDCSIAWADGQDSFLFSDAEPRQAVAFEAATELAEEVAGMAAPSL